MEIISTKIKKNINNNNQHNKLNNPQKYSRHQNGLLPLGQNFRLVSWKNLSYIYGAQMELYGILNNEISASSVLLNYKFFR